MYYGRRMLHYYISSLKMWFRYFYVFAYISFEFFGRLTQGFFVQSIHNIVIKKDWIHSYIYRLMGIETCKSTRQNELLSSLQLINFVLRPIKFSMASSMNFFQVYNPIYQYIKSLFTSLTKHVTMCVGTSFWQHHNLKSQLKLPHGRVVKLTYKLTIHTTSQLKVTG